MRRLALLMPLLMIALASAGAAEHLKTYPLWDGEEAIGSYARRVELPATKEVRLPGGTKLELVLIPAGRFVKGTPRPERPDLQPLLNQMYIGAYLCLSAVGCLTVVICYAIYWSRRDRHRTQYSLARFMVMAIMASVVLMGGLHGYLYYDRIERAEREYAASLQRRADADLSEKSARMVEIPRPFYLGRYEVTQEQFEGVEHRNPSSFKGPKRPIDSILPRDVQSFCESLLSREQIRLRLPSDSEWEFACRAGTRSPYYNGEDVVALALAGWFDQNSNKSTHDVGKKAPNPFGLYDMHGNVAEWCGDIFDVDDAYGFETELGRCQWVRGGSWLDDEVRCRVAYRYALPDVTSGSDLGFRVAMDLDGTHWESQTSTLNEKSQQLAGNRH